MARLEKRGEEKSLSRLTPGGGVNPFSVMRRLSDEMERLFEGPGLWEPRWPRLSPALEPTAGRSPDVDVYESNGRLVIRADLPGLTKDDVNVEISDGELLIEGRRQMEKEEKEEGAYRRECTYGAFRRALVLPEGIKTDKAKASFKNGVLEITMPAPAHPEKHGRRLRIAS